ncbi:serine hydrolase domain-containing protein [Streptomyces telluris]|uniref:Beta-lactamase family protein n=1 Tax=Streptomyces telluris TaxID=2720021 RepID=A0A9X2RMZ7_9ACTN|nr:serine hydrolase domain-containing protein [Streptomyces telluris]MCQ8771374.1 beta-lactamase family protein [Streptomyces telluris]NJP77322.1 beta-lactamase family protein [Streptomyces telluris]
MHVFARRRLGLLLPAGLAAVLLAALAGPASADADADAQGGSVTRPRPAGLLQQAVNAIHGTGTVGVLAEVRSPGTRHSARAGTAELGTGRPVPRGGSFRIGSATKTFTATVVLQLVGEGQMSLDDTVERWLPGVVQGNGHDGRRITVRQLLQHTSAIPDVLGDIPALNSAAGYRAERLRTYTSEELVALAMRHPATNDPGVWSYSNTNYILAGMIIKKVTGHSWADEVNARIIGPLRLTKTSTPGSSPSIPGPHAHGYRGFGTGTALDVTEFNPSAVDASGSIISSADDLSRFYTALFDGRLLDPARLDEMTTTVSAPELKAEYGLGLAEFSLPCGGSYFTHVGGVSGYRTQVGVTPDATRTTVVLATGDGDKNTQKAMSRLMEQGLCRSKVQ